MGNLVPAQNYDHLLVAVSGYNGMQDRKSTRLNSSHTT
jgi:hypothetical protein